MSKVFLFEIRPGWKIDPDHNQKLTNSSPAKFPAVARLPTQLTSADSKEPRARKPPRCCFPCRLIGLCRASRWRLLDENDKTNAAHAHSQRQTTHTRSLLPRVSQRKLSGKTKVEGRESFLSQIKKVSQGDAEVAKKTKNILTFKMKLPKAKDAARRVKGKITRLSKVIVKQTVTSYYASSADIY